jgi:uncharacterized protein (DUF1501 family)
MPRKKVKEQTNIVTVVSFGRSSRCASKIAIAHTVGSTVTLMTLGGVTKDGTNFTPTPALRRMLETNGQKATEVTQENGNEL